MLSDREIKRQMEDAYLQIAPFDQERLQPASYDLTLGDEWGVPLAEIGKFAIYQSPAWLLRPDDFILATTQELVSIPPTLYARVEGKSTWGRKGLLVVCTAGFVDPGFVGQITLEIKNVGPWVLELRQGEPIAQLAIGPVEGLVEKAYFRQVPKSAGNRSTSVTQSTPSPKSTPSPANAGGRGALNVGRGNRRGEARQGIPKRSKEIPSPHKPLRRREGRGKHKSTPVPDQS